MKEGYLDTPPVVGFIGRRDVDFNSSYSYLDNQTHIDKRGLTPCSKCCSTNLCNADTCQNAVSPPTQVSVLRYRCRYVIHKSHERGK